MVALVVMFVVLVCYYCVNSVVVMRFFILVWCFSCSCLFLNWFGLVFMVFLLMVLVIDVGFVVVRLRALCFVGVTAFVLWDLGGGFWCFACGLVGFGC